LNLVIVGGGTAGWLTAIYAQKIFPDCNITLVESEEIGILGAGEGLTPHAIDLLDFLNIPLSDLIKNCNATIKSGIKFTNWEDNEYYYHPFAINKNLSGQWNNFSKNFYYGNEKNYFHLFNFFENSYKKNNFINNICENSKVPFIPEIESIYYNNNIEKYKSLQSWSTHFDAKEFALFLRKVGEGRGIKRINGMVKEILTDENGYIKFLKTEKEELPCSFVFDCTGFKRLIIGKFYKSEWKSHSEFLPAKRAAPFFLDIDNENIPPYTESIAMDYGWSWKIPLQHRFGCGYVFDSDFISDELVEKEIQNKFGDSIQINKFFSFSAGVYKKVWIKNCLSVGLSSGFIEPLEATSIWQSILLLRNFFSERTNITSKNEKNIEKINSIYLKQTQEVVDFIYLHYMTKKQQNNFWKNFTLNNKVPDFIEYVFEVSKERILSDEIDFYDKGMFFSSSYLHIIDGNGLFTEKTKNKYINEIDNEDIFKIKKIIQKEKEIAALCVSHSDFLNNLN
jgi:tryptophan halogenase